MTTTQRNVYKPSAASSVEEVNVSEEERDDHRTYFEAVVPCQPPFVDHSPKLEICVDNYHSAITAADGGADRIELCQALELGGLTPSIGLISQVMAPLLPLPIFMMIRPRSGNFVYTNHEIMQMEHDIKYGIILGVDGFVTGALCEDGTIDKEACYRLINAAKGRPVTFHRAFDLAADEYALETVIELGFTRILTSGRERNAYEGKEMIKRLVDQADNRIIVVAGSGVNSSNIKSIYDATKVYEFHASAQKPRLVLADENELVKGTSFYPIANLDIVKELRQVIGQFPI